MPDADDRGPDGLRGLPPEWGRVVVPDDAAALADEAAQLRRELAAKAGSSAAGDRPQRTGDRRRAARSPAGGGLPPRPHPLLLPVAIVLTAVLATVAGLLGTGWSRPQRATDQPVVLTQEPTPDQAGRTLPALDLVDADQSPVPLRALLPAVILLVDDCRCTDVIGAVTTAVPPGVTVVTVVSGRSAPAGQPSQGGPGQPVRALADPASGLRAFLHLRPAPQTAAALLVDRTGVLVRVLPTVGPIEQYRSDLERLAPR